MGINTLKPLEDIAAKNVCAICEGELSVAWDGKVGEYVIRCPGNLDHQGYMPRPDFAVERLQRWIDRALRQNAEQGYPQSHEILKANLEEDALRSLGADLKSGRKKALQRWNRRRVAMVEQQTTEVSKALSTYQKKAVLTQVEATMVLKTIWPDAPTEEVTKAAILCKDFGLHPLMKHVFLIPFKETKTGNVNWSIILGISATRLMASRRGPVEYLDMSPRIMSEDEERKVNGKRDTEKVWAITHVRNPLTGASAFGVGWWGTRAGVYGQDKGNTQENMAKIRSERQALDRLFPGDMPYDASIEVMDEKYAPTIEVEGKVIEKETGEIKESPAPAPAQESPVGTALHPWLEACPEHGDGWVVHRASGKRMHKRPDGTNCYLYQAIQIPKVEDNLPTLWADVGEGSCNEWIKASYEGKTISQISDEQVIEIIEKLKTWRQEARHGENVCGTEQPTRPEQPEEQQGETKQDSMEL